MNEYCEVVKSQGQKRTIPVLDVQSVFDTAVKQRPAREWAEDQIHPQHEGHSLIASAAFAFLKDQIT
jgi:lysophospholipase L1-like esterase